MNSFSLKSWAILIRWSSDFVLGCPTFMLRILLTLFVCSVATPASWAEMTTVPVEGIEWIGASCCDRGDCTPPVQESVDETCCCRPTPCTASLKRVGAMPLPTRKAAHALVPSRGYIYSFQGDMPEMRGQPDARGPPFDTLVTQYILLLL